MENKDLELNIPEKVYLEVEHCLSCNTLEKENPAWTNNVLTAPIQQCQAMCHDASTKYTVLALANRTVCDIVTLYENKTKNSQIPPIRCYVRWQFIQEPSKLLSVIISSFHSPIVRYCVHST